MSGLAGCLFPKDMDRVRRLLPRVGAAFDGPNHEIKTYADEHFVVVVAGRYGDDKSISASFGELVEDERYVLACEGYFANLDELLEDRHRVEDRSRGEILIDLYATHGRQVFTRLGGGFNIVVWDKQEKAAEANTCKYGQRTLYYQRLGESIIFSTEIHVIPHLSGSPLSLNHDMLRFSFLCGLTYGAETLIRDVKRIEPGATLHFSKTSLDQTFNPIIAAEPIKHETRSVREHLEELDALLQRSVTRLARIRPRNAVMMSRGIDSPLVAAYLQLVTKKCTTLTLALPRVMDESRGADSIAQRIKADHHTWRYTLEATDLVRDIDELVRIMEEPIWLYLAVPLLHFASATKHLADGLFAGVEGDGLFGEREYGGADEKKTSMFEFTISPFDADLLEQYINLQGPHPDSYIRHLEKFSPASNYDRYAYINLLTAGWFTVRFTAQLAQHYGAEAFFPFLDQEVVDFSFTVPDWLKLSEDMPKILLQLLFVKYIGKDLLPRRKEPFWANTLQWCYEADRLNDVLDLLSEKRTSERGVYKKHELQQLIAGYRRKQVRPAWHPILWQIVSFEIFCRRFFDDPPPLTQPQSGAGTLEYPT